MSPRELTAGQTIAERYRLIALRGSGGMGSVWRAVHLPDQHECALKILHRSTFEHGARMNERFMREARAASSIDSPHAVRVLDYGMHAEIPFIAMELLEGETLAARLQSQGRIDPLETSRIIDHIACALERAHALGIVHRDLKPENVFLADSDGGTVAKVLDFGIAKLHDDEALARDLTETGALLGTPHYMSPEQIEGARYVDHRADLWSLAVIAFECITGQRPFKGDGLRALFGAICLAQAPVPSALCSVPRGFDAWFAKASQKDPARRFRSASELASALRRACEQELAFTPTADEPDAAPQPRSLAAPRPSAARSHGPPQARPQPRGTAIRWVLASVIILALAGWLSTRLWIDAPPMAASSNAAPAPIAASHAVEPDAPPRTGPAPTAMTPIVDVAPPPPPNAVVALEASGEAVRSMPVTARARSTRGHEPRARKVPRARNGIPPLSDRAAVAEDATRLDVDVMLRDRK